MKTTEVLLDIERVALRHIEPNFSGVLLDIEPVALRTIEPVVIKRTCVVDLSLTSVRQTPFWSSTIIERVALRYIEP